MPGRAPTVCGFGYGSFAVGLGALYGTARPGVKRVMEMANLEGSGLFEAGSWGILGFGTGMYVLTRETRDCFWMEYSGSGAPSA